MDKKLAGLTEEEERIVEEVKEDWVNFVLRGGDDIDEAMAKEAVNWLYTFCGFKEPELIVVDSPFGLQESINELAGNTEKKFYNYSYESLAQASGWAAKIEIFIKLGIINFTEFENYRKLLRCGNFMSIYLDGYALICRRPLYVKRNERNQLHSVDSPAMEWRDGYKAYFLNGVPVSEDIVMTPGEKLDPNLVIKTVNAEIRREIVRKIGIERVYQKLGGKTIDTYGEYRLVTLAIPDMTIVPKYLIMRNPSIGTFHMEGIPPDVNTVKEALAWRDGDLDGYIEPTTLT